MSFLEQSWEEREEKVYKQIFGDTGEGIFPLYAEVFERMNVDAIDPRWLSHGVFQCPPAGGRKTWAYVTSGMSNPWESDTAEEYSGLGVEFLMETSAKESWAIDVLHTLMAYNLLLAAGKMGDFPPLDYGHRVPLALSESISTMLFTQPEGFPDTFSIQSGAVDFIQIFGITPAELEAAKKTSSAEIREAILRKTGGLVSEKERISVV